MRPWFTVERTINRAAAAYVFTLVVVSFGATLAKATTQPNAPGKLVDLGGHRLHVNCSGSGTPTVVVENGLGDFSFDWILVQNPVSKFTRICTYDRAGYAWSDPGPKPRTFAQINLELHDALLKLGERDHYLLVGHSYGGPVLRNFAIMYPTEVAGMVLVDAAFEGERVGIGSGKTMRLGDKAKGVPIPPAREEMNDQDRPTMLPQIPPELGRILDPMYRVLPPAKRKLQLWAQSQPVMYDAEKSQLEWSGEYFSNWLHTAQKGSLGSIPLIVLTRQKGGYENNADVPAAQWEQERKDGQAMLVLLSSNSKQKIVHAGHNMELEAPEQVIAAIREVVQAVQSNSKLRSSYSSARSVTTPRYSVESGWPLASLSLIDLDYATIHPAIRWASPEVETNRVSSSSIAATN